MSDVYLQERLIINKIPTVSPVEIRQVPVDSTYPQEDSAISSVIRSQSDYITNLSPYNFIHSAMKNEFYSDLCTALSSENQNIIDYLNELKTLYDIDYYDGDKNSFLNKISNLSSLFNFYIPVEFLPFTNIEQNYNLTSFTSSMDISEFGNSTTTSTSIIDNGITQIDEWTINEWANYAVTIIQNLSGTITTQNSIIVSNGYNDIVLETPWIYTPGSTYTYTVYGNKDNVTKQNDFLRNIAKRIWLMRRWVGSLYGYKLPVKLLHRVGAVHLGALNLTNTAQTTTDRVYKYLDTTKFSNLLPYNSGTMFPSAGNVDGIPNFSLVRPQYYHWDTGIAYDVTDPAYITPDNPLGFVYRYDVAIPLINSSKELLIEIALDRLLTYPNTISSNPSYCLLENIFLQTAEKLTENVARGQDSINIGSQLTLIANKNGTYNGFTLNTVGTVLTDGTKSWTSNFWVGATVEITSGVSVGLIALVTSNTGTVLSLDIPLTLDTTSKYKVYDTGGNIDTGIVTVAQYPEYKDYSHPNIKAKFQVDYAKWNALSSTSDVSYIKVGTGGFIKNGTAGDVIANPQNSDFSKATASGTTTLTDSTRTWIPHFWVGATVTIISGESVGLSASITDNTITELSLGSSLTTDTTSEYLITLNSQVSDTGTITSFTSTPTVSLTDSSKNSVAISNRWNITNFWKDAIVTITSGTGAGSSNIVTGHSGTTLTLETSWTVGIGSVYSIKKTIDGNVFIDNFSGESQADPNKVQLSDLQESLFSTPLVPLEITGTEGYDLISGVVHKREISLPKNPLSLTINGASEPIVSLVPTTISFTPFSTLSPGSVEANINIDVFEVEPLITGYSSDIDVVTSYISPVFYFTLKGIPLTNGNISFSVKRFAQNITYDYTWVAAPTDIYDLASNLTTALLAQYHDWNISVISSEITDSGAPTTSGTTTLTDSSKDWGVDFWVGAKLEIISGTSVGESAFITSNTATVLSLDSSIITDESCVYTISFPTIRMASQLGEFHQQIAIYEILDKVNQVYNAKHLVKEYFCPTPGNNDPGTSLVSITDFAQDNTTPYLYSCYLTDLENITTGYIIVNGYNVTVYKTDSFEDIASRIAQTKMPNWKVTWQFSNNKYYIYIEYLYPFTSSSSLDTFQGYIDDPTYEKLTQVSYFPLANPNAFNLVQLRSGGVPLVDSQGNPKYISIDYGAGTITFILQYNSNGVFANVWGATQASSTETFAIDRMCQMAVVGSGQVAISELGLFDIDNNMVAYATFPSIIYEPNKYHLSVNLLIST